MKAWLNHEAPEVIDITPERYVQDVLMTGLRTKGGVNTAQLEARSGINVLTRYNKLIDSFTKQHLLQLDDHHLSATEKGLLQLNGLVSSFLD